MARFAACLQNVTTRVVFASHNHTLGYTDQDGLKTGPTLFQGPSESAQEEKLLGAATAQERWHAR